MERAFAGVFGVRIALSPVRRLVDQPDVLFRPPGILEWLHGMPPSTLVGVLQVVGVLAAAARLSGRAPRSSFVGVWVVALVIAGLRSSMGKILHNDVLILVAAAPLVLAAMARGSSAPTPRWSGWPVRLSLAAVAAAYTTAGFQKVRWSGWDWALGENMKWIMLEGAAGSRSNAPWIARAIAMHPPAPQVFACSLLFVELTFLLVLFGRRVRLGYCMAATGIHLGTYVLLGLDYWTWIAADCIVLGLFDVEQFRHRGWWRRARTTGWASPAWARVSPFVPRRKAMVLLGQVPAPDGFSRSTVSSGRD